MTKPMRIAVIVPTLNEGRNLSACLSSLQRQTRPADQIVVADGGSTDDTLKIAAEMEATVFACPRRGRGLQVRDVLECTTVDVAVVLHGDMILRPESLAAIDAYLLAHVESPGGCLGHRFAGNILLLRAIEFVDWLRARFRGISYGDQVQFFRVATLDKIGGFPEQPIMEDLELSLRLRQIGPVCYLGIPAAVSARRFDRLGIWRTIFANLRYRWEYRKGGLAACEAIYRQYHGTSASG